MVSVVILFTVLFIQSFFPMPDIDEPEYLVRNYTVQDGLPVNSINNIVQDDDGYLYFSTFDGLVQYDGYRFRVFNTSNTEGITSNRIQNMIRTSDNSIWLIKETGAVTRKKGPFFKTWEPSDVRSNVNRIVEHPDLGVWAATNTGIARFNPDTELFEFFTDSLLSERTRIIIPDFENKLLIVNQNGLIHFDGFSSKQLLDQQQVPIPPDDIMRIQQYHRDYIWILGIGGFFRYNLISNSIDFTYISPDEMNFWDIVPSEPYKYIISASQRFYTHTLDISTMTLNKIDNDNYSGAMRSRLIYETPGGDEVWVGDNHLYINGKIVLTARDIRMALIDREGSIWLATNTEGIYQVKKGSFVNLTPETVPGLVNTYSIVQSNDGSIWAGSFFNGIFRFNNNGVTNWNLQNSNLTSEIVHYLFADTDGSVYAATNGLWKFKDESWEFIHELEELHRGRPSVQAMHRQGDRIFIGSSQPVAVYEKGRYRFFNDSWSEELSRVRVIREDSNGNLWFGTDGRGISRYSDGKLTTFTTENNTLTSNVIRDIFVQSADTVWVATQDMGLNRLVFSAEGKYHSTTSISTRDGLIHNSLHRVIEDPSGYLWISSNGGIMRVSKQNLNDYADGRTPLLNVLGFDENDGMVNREANGGVESAGLLAADQKIWFPNQKGITIIDPANITSADFPGSSPNPVIEAVALSESLIFYNGRSALTLPKGERNFRVAFTAPNFAWPGRVDFRYKLEGVHETWQDGTQSREAVLTNIPPGNHEFQLMTQVISEDPVTRSLLITIPPYFYETGWFRLLLILGSLALVWAGIIFRTRALQRREKQLQKRVDLQTKELKKADEQKNRFFTGITHELKTPLSLILGPLDDMLEENRPQQWEKIRSRLHMMHRNSYRLKHLVDQILDVSKLNAEAVRLTHQPEHIGDLTQQIAGQFQSKLEQAGIKLIIHFDEIEDRIYIDHEAWERIIINLMSNAIKFSPKGSAIRLSLADGDNDIVFSIKDEGCGIAAADHKKVFEYLYQADGGHAAEGTGIGLFLVKGLVEHMGGKIDLLSEEGAGAEFVITLKKGCSHFKAQDTILHDEPESRRTTAVPSVSKAPDNPVDVSEEKDAPLILVVEDNTDFRTYLHSFMQKRYNLLFAGDGNKALEILASRTPDLIISDVMMPGMNGLEFVNTLRKQDRFRHLPVIFLSAKSREADVETGLSSGADIYLTKPIRSNILLTQITAVLRREEVLKSGHSNERENPFEPEFKAKVREIVYRQLANPSLNIPMIADTLYMSRTKLYGEWNKVSGVSLNDFIKKQRFTEAKVLIKEQQFSVHEAAHAVGFSDANYFSASFKKEFGFSPSKLFKENSPHASNTLHRH